MPGIGIMTKVINMAIVDILNIPVRMIFAVSSPIVDFPMTIPRSEDSSFLAVLCGIGPVDGRDFLSLSVTLHPHLSSQGGQGRHGYVHVGHPEKGAPLSLIRQLWTKHADRYQRRASPGALQSKMQ